MNAKTMILALMTVCGTALAQPASFTDLGNHASTGAFTQPVTTLGVGDVQWFRIQLGDATPAGGYVDIWTTPTANPTPATDMTDTEIGLYQSDGSGAGATYNDDDDGPGLWSALSFGSLASRGTTTYTGQGAGVDRNGRDGPLVAGVYYLAVVRYNATFAAGFTVTPTSTSTQTTTLLNFDINVPTSSYPPAVIGAVDLAMAQPGQTVLYTARVYPGGLPTSTGMTVSGNLTPVGGLASQAFFDDGSHGDATAGDGVFSFSYQMPAAVSGGQYTVVATAGDAQGRSSTANINGNVFNPPDIGVVGSTPVSRTFDIAGPSDIKWLKFTTTADCDPVTNYLDIDSETSLLTGTGTNPNDTEIGLYTAAGALVASDDDSGSGALSQLTFGATGNPRPAVGNGLPYTGTDGANGVNVPAGQYFLAFGVYNLNFAGAFGVTHTDSPITTGSAGTITINFNSNLPGGMPTCGAADVGGVGGVAGADGHLDNNDFVVFIDFFFNHNPLADQGSTGGAPGADGAWDNNDFVVFIDNFFTAPASCR
jgi:hypothetical protein